MKKTLLLAMLIPLSSCIVLPSKDLQVEPIFINKTANVESIKDIPSWIIWSSWGVMSELNSWTWLMGTWITWTWVISTWVVK